MKLKYFTKKKYLKNLKKYSKYKKERKKKYKIAICYENNQHSFNIVRNDKYFNKCVKIRKKDFL